MLESDGIEESVAVDMFLNIFNPAKKTLIVAHNAQFDLSFVFKLIEKHRKSIPVTFDILDTMTVFRDRKAFPHTLKDAIEYYQIEGVENSHRAIDDVKALFEIVKQMKAERDDLADYINLIGVHRVHGLQGEKIDRMVYVIQMLGSKNKRLPDFLKEGKRIYSPEKLKETRPLIFKE
jgi:DNA polymerase-3 subunit epsilon